MRRRFFHKEKFLFVMCGLPGTGKTTGAKKLAERLSGYALVDQNEVRRAHGIKRMPKTQDAVLRDIDQLTAKYLAFGLGVIFESGNRYSFRRNQMYGIASAFGRRVILLEMVCGEELAKKRIRSRPPGDGLLSDPTDPAVYDRLKALWEDVMIDFKHAGNSHVTYIQFDTGTQALKPVVVQKNMKHIFGILAEILKQ